MLANYRIVLLQRDAVRVVALVLAGDVGEAGARGGLQLDDRADIVTCH